MRQIIYNYSSFARQVMLGTLSFLLTSRLLLFLLAYLFKLEEFLIFNIPATLVGLFLLNILSVFLMVAHHFFYFSFTEDRISSYNQVLKKTKTVDLKEVARADFSSRSIGLFSQEGALLLKIPFYRFGLVQPQGVQSFDQLLAYKNIPRNKKDFRLPQDSRLVGLARPLYFALALFLALAGLQTLVLDILILKSQIS
ncbi:MAG: hypothetical protein Q4E37_06590 [Tissierellia bacterium]|nr:hypothetical protein [Tissierellia bacterium]